MAATNRDFIAQLDAAIGCQQCGNPLGDSPSADFCGADCQQAWTASRAQALSSYVEPVEHPAHARNLVELHSPETCVACTDGYDHHFVPDYVWAQVRERALAVRQRDLQVIEELRQRDPMARTEFAAVIDEAATRVANAWYGRFPQRFMLGVDPGGDVVGMLPDGSVGRVDHVVVAPDIRRLDEALRNTVRRMASEAEISVEWIERHLDVTLTDWQAEFLRGQHELRERHRARAREVALAMQPVFAQAAEFMRGFADGVREAAAALQPLAEALAQRQPADPRERALWLRRNRNTGPAVSARAPRTINPRRR